MFSLFLDDALTSHYEHRDFFDSHGVQPAVCVPTDKIGQSGRMTWEQLHEVVEDYGWSVVNHGKSETTLGSLDEAGVVSEVYDSHKKLLQEGFNPHVYVYHGGDDGGNVGQGVVSELYPYGRTAGSQAQQFERNPYAAPSKETDNTDLSELTADVDDAVSNSVPGVFHAHTIIDGTRTDEGTLETSTGKLADLFDYVKNNADGWVTTDRLVRHFRYRKFGHPDSVSILISGNGNARIEDVTGSSLMTFDDDLGGIVNFNSDNVQFFADTKVDFRNSFVTNLMDGTGATDLGVEFNGGAGFYVNSSGEIVAVDEAGNETILT